MRQLILWTLVVCVSAFALNGARGCNSDDDVIVASPCQVLKDPGAYNHKRLQISGIISRGFEDFTISREGCSDRSAMMIWLDFGGTKGANVMYCCGVPKTTEKARPLVVEGIETHLVTDAILEKFDRLTDRPKGGKARATIVGRFFSGEKQTFPGGTYWVGYGHMGMGTLFVIEKVVSADPP